MIFAFHVVGTMMEIFKTGAGSWIYPEPSLLRIAGVPLFSGFMYAAVGSYIARSWRIMEFRFVRFPPLWMQALLAIAVYANFFTHHWLPDMRLALFVASAAIYGPCMLYYRPTGTSVHAASGRVSCWWRCSSGSPKTWVPSPAPGSIPARMAAGIRLA